METTLDHFMGLLTSQMILIIIVISVVLWIYALVDLFKSSFEGTHKLIWVLVILFLPIIGSILYISIGRKQKKY